MIIIRKTSDRQQNFSHCLTTNCAASLWAAIAELADFTELTELTEKDQTHQKVWNHGTGRNNAKKGWAPGRKSNSLKSVFLFP